MLSKKGISLLFLGLFAIMACQKETETVRKETGAPFQMTVVFAPGQLGDLGYADNVIRGLGELKHIDISSAGDSLSVEFMSFATLKDTKNILKAWAADPKNPFFGNEYRRRYLVLTEPFMIPWLEDIRDDIREYDEVILLKVNQADVEAAASTYGLGRKVHGVNIRLDATIQKFLTFVKADSEACEEEGFDLLHDQIPVYRLFSPDVMNYRDGVVDILVQDKGEENIPVKWIIDNVNSNASPFNSLNLVNAAMAYAQEMAVTQEEELLAYAIVDMGSGNSGWDCYLLGQESPFEFRSLMIDSQDFYANINRYYVQRDFGAVLVKWMEDAMLLPPGAMPTITEYTNGQYCLDNIPE